MDSELVQLLSRYWTDAGVGIAMATALYALKLAANHLNHIQQSGEQTVEGLNRLATAFEVHDAHEHEHHEAEMVILASLLKK